VKHLVSWPDNESSCLIRMSVACEAYGDYGYPALFTICFTCYIPNIKRLFSYRFVSRRLQEVPRRFKTHPRGFKTALIWFQEGKNVQHSSKTVQEELNVLYNGAKVERSFVQSTVCFVAWKINQNWSTWLNISLLFAWLYLRQLRLRGNSPVAVMVAK
jgi:hypothetical protein